MIDKIPLWKVCKIRAKYGVNKVNYMKGLGTMSLNFLKHALLMLR